VTVSQVELAGHVGHQTKIMAPRRALIILLVVAVILSPSFKIREGFYEPRGEDFILVAFIMLWYVPTILAGRQGATAHPYKTKTSASSPISAIFAAMFYVALISILAGTIVFQQQIIVNDWMILPMIIRYWMIFQVGQSIRQPTERHTYLWVLVISLGVSATVGVLQHFNLFGINDWLTPLYVLPHMKIVGLEMVKLGLPGARVVGTNGDPRHYAYILVVGTALCLAILLNSLERRAQITAVMVLGLCLMGIAFSASRTAALNVIIVFFVAIVIQRPGLGGATKLLGALLVIVLLLAMVSSMSGSSVLQERVVNIDDSSYDRSLYARERDLMQPLRSGLENPVIWLTGRGPSKAVLRTDSHNDFGWYFQRFGLPGLFLYLWLLIYSLRLTLRAWRKEAAPLERVVIMLACFSIVNWFIFAMAENIFKDPQLMALNMLLLGTFAGITRSKSGY
jgi:O-antigen ligase